MMKKLLYIFCLVGLFSCDSDSTGVSDIDTGDGQGGSFATFTLKGDYLYAVDNRKLNSFEISGEDQSNPNFVNSTDVGFGIETLFGFKENLFIGSSNAMYIYNLETPNSPDFESVSNHFRACDPVIANDTHAFVTIHGGTFCGGDSNQLIVYDIEDLASPNKLLDFNLVEPKGLALYMNKYLFVADTAIRIFDITNLENEHTVSIIDKIDVDANDLIIRDNKLYAISNSGVFQYKLEENTELTVTTISELYF